MNRILFSIVVLFILGCASTKREIYVEKIPVGLSEDINRFDTDNIVYPINREILFSCSIQLNGKKVDSELKYVRMVILGTTLPFSKIDSTYSQTVIKFEYLNSNNENEKKLLYERTGLIENNNNIWFHPPRSGELGILQLSAFPFIKLNNKKKWKWHLDAGYQNYKNVHLIHSYKKLKAVDYETEYGLLKCIPIIATSKSYIGTTTSKFLYNEKYGFIRLEFNSIDNTKTILIMVKNEIH